MDDINELAPLPAQQRPYPMNYRTLLASLLFLVVTLLGLVHAESSHDSGSIAPDSFEAPKNTDPNAIVDYVINFDEMKVKKEDMDVVVNWLKERNIEVKENEMASYAAYLVAPMNRAIADELIAFGNAKNLQIEEVEPDYLDWSDMEKDDL